LRAGALAIDVEGDAHLHERAFGGTLAVEQLAFGKALDVLHQHPGRGARVSVFAEDFVEEPGELVMVELHGRSAGQGSASTRSLPLKPFPASNHGATEPHSGAMPSPGDEQS